MKQGIHPEYIASTIICGCGQKIETRSTQPEIHVEICSNCHPFYTGKQRLVDTAGRVERFNRKYGKKKTEAADDANAKAAGKTADDTSDENAGEATDAAETVDA